jgi:medium-chain acyl-[acyl-carrier-protein] hydrolase
MAAGGKGLYRPSPRHDPAVRLFCLPFAGGGAESYRLWPRSLPESIELIAFHPPGRAPRLREAPLTSIDAMVEAILAELSDWIDRPFAIFGHSLGAVVAAECVRALEAQGRAPIHLLVSARPPRRELDNHLHQLPDAEFIAAMNRRYRGIPDEILNYPDVLALLLPSLRADLKALETFRPDPGRPKIACPTTVFGGSLDRAVSRLDLESWRNEVAGSCVVRVFPGDHFYLVPQRLNLVAEIVATLRPLLKESAGADAVT